MRKVIAGVLMGAAVLSLAACGKTETAATTAAQTAESQGYLHLHFVINTKTEEKVLEFVDIMYLHYKDSVNSNVYIFAKLYC